MRCLGLAVVLAGPALAATGGENPTIQRQMARIQQGGAVEAVPLSATAPDYGTTDLSIVNVHAYAFQGGRTSDLILDDGNGYRYYGATPADPFMAAPVQIPSGVMIDAIGISVCSAAAGDLVVSLFDKGCCGAGSGGGTNLGSFTVPGAGCGEGGAFINTMYPTNANHPLYLVIHWAGNHFDGSTKFNMVYVRYRRVVSPAPASATFTDVPTTSPQFKFVEALVAAGITAGCGGGNYCPDAPITRGQMAVFLATALGLHWPN